MRLYQLLLRLYPSAFRSEYGEEMSLVFSDRRRQASGPLSNLALWLEVLPDVLVNAFQVHWDIFRQDLRYSFRTFARSKGFVLTAVLVTAMGVGANTAVFSIIDQVLIRPLPYPQSGRLVKLWEHPPGYSRHEVSPPNYLAWERTTTAFETMAAFHWLSMNLIGQGEPLMLRGTATRAELFPMLGIEPLVGRFLTPEDEKDKAPPTIVLTYGLWQRVFGGEPVLGNSIRLDQTGYTIVGILPKDFGFPNRQNEFWIAKRFDDSDEDMDNNYLQVLAKLAPGVSLDQARAEMEVVTEQLERAYPEENRDTRATVIPLRDEVSEQARLLLAALFGASLCVLFIACTNLANLLLARAIERRKEMTVRTALGGRDRLARQLLTESLLLAGIGGLFGAMLATAAVPLLSRLVPTSLPIADMRTLDLRVLAFAALVTLVTGIGFGVLPAVRCSSGVKLSTLKEGSRSGAGGQRERLRSALVIAEVTVSVILLVCAGLLIRALLRVQAVDPGFRPEGVLAFNTPLPLSKYGPTSRRAELYQQVLTDLRAFPGVSSAAYVSFLPMVMRGGIWPVKIADAPDGDDSSVTASLRFVTPGFFSTMGIPLRAGRDVSDTDTEDSPFVAVVSESFVRRHWPDQAPLGRRFEFAFRERIVAGVVGNIRVRGLERGSEPQVYLPHRQVPDGALPFYVPKELVIRSSVDDGALVATVRQSVARADPELPIAEVRRLEEVLGSETAPRDLQIRVLGAFAGLALILAGVGIYGVLSFSVSRRRSEIGLRIALGARSSEILSMVLREGALLALLGVVLGGAFAYGAGRAMESLLFGVAPGDSATYVAAAMVAVTMTLAGSLRPALRAVRVDPTEALRAE